MIKASNPPSISPIREINVSENQAEAATLIELIERTLANRAEHDSLWSFRVEPEQSPRWIHIHSSRAILPDQGWKLHISACRESAIPVLRACLPVLLAEDVSFKVVYTPRLLDELNQGRVWESQVGKFVTVYPENDCQAVRLAVALDQATNGLRGPAVPSDWQFATGSLVYYRYGGFSARLLQTPIGEIAPAITGPDGELIRDRRTCPPKLASWLVNPFVVAGYDIPSTSSNVVIGGRYLLNATLHQSPRGSVYLGIDCRELRPCILKAARHNDVIQPDGTDACDRLRREAAILLRLACHPYVPKMIELIEQDDRLYLIMTDIEGETLVDHLSKMNAVGQHASNQQIAAWGLSLSTMLGALHRDGVIHSDLNATNIIITPDGLTHLVDFELAHDLTDSGGSCGLGTRGYVRPERHRTDLPTIADDIFGLGALLYFAATGAEPSQAPLSGGLFRRSVRSLNPMVSPELVKVISRCLGVDPADRFASMAEVCFALNGIVEASAAHSLSTQWSSLRRDAETPFDARWLARQLGDSLCRSAQPASAGVGVEWTSTHDLSIGIPSYDLNIGSAGTVLALAELVREIGDPTHRDVLRHAAQRLVTVAGFEGRPLPGLYVGEAGIGVALLRAGQVLRDGQLIAAAEQRGRQIAQYPHCSPDLFNGTAGRLRFHLWLWHQTSKSEHLCDAIGAGEALLAAAEDVGHGLLRWSIPPGYDDLSGSAYLGYAHGAAGIADVLLDLFNATADERFLEAAASAGRWVARSGIRVLDDGSGFAWPVTAEDGSPSPAYWCHGSTGIGTFFLHSAEFDIFPRAMELAEGAARCVAQGTRWTGPTKCHGLAGNIEFLLDLFQSTRNSIYLDEAKSLGQVLCAFETQRDGKLLWPSESATTFSPDYMLGYAGVAMAFLRLSAPDRIPNQLSDHCFRTTINAVP